MGKENLPCGVNIEDIPADKMVEDYPEDTVFVWKNNEPTYNDSD